MNKELFDYFTTDNNSGKKCTEKWLRNNNESLYNEINSWSERTDILKDIEFKRKVYHYINEMTYIPTCKTCGSSIKYRRLKDGYGTYCSDKCVKNSDEYYENWLSSIKKTNSSGLYLEKRKKTLESKYGNLYNKVIQENREKSMNEKYGVYNSFQILEIKKKRKKTLKEKYGSEKFNNPDKTRITRIKNGTQINDEIIKEFIDYKKVATNRTITIYNNNKELINPKNLKRSKKDYHIDHIYSLKQGFLNNIPVEIITHPCNLHMINYKDNLIKQDNCWIEIEDLLKKIIYFNIEINFTHENLKNKYSDIKEKSENILIDLYYQP